MSTDRRTLLLAQLQVQTRLQTARTVAFHQAVASSIGLAVTDFTCLNLLQIEGPMTAGRLAERAGLTPGGAITAAVDRLEAAGYVHRRRDKSDRRRVIVELDDGRAGGAIGPVFGLFIRAWEDYLADFDDESLQIVTEFLTGANDVVSQATLELRTRPS